MADLTNYKRTVLDMARRLVEERYLAGSGGNLSVLVEGSPLIAITPSSMDYLLMKESDICIVDFDLKQVEGGSRPSIETGMHLAVYKARPDVNVVIHTHQVYPSLFALTGESIPALFDEQVANLGPTVQVIPYGLSGSQDLLNNIAAAVPDGCNAFVLQNHGALLLGITPEKAMTNVKLLDKVAQAYYLARSLQKPVIPLPENAVNLLFALMKNGQKKEIERKQGLNK